MAKRHGMTALGASGLEALAVLAALRNMGALALALHAASSGCGALWLGRRLLDGPPGRSFGLFFGGLLFLPVLGAVGILAAALAAPRAGRSSDPGLLRTRIPGPPLAPDEAPRAPDEARRRGGRDDRIAAVMAARGRSDRSAVELFRQGLEDPDEDVRLLAHALLESRSRAAYRAIHESSRELEAAFGTRCGSIHRRLAFQHWELAWLELVQGECLDHALGMARRHALAALADGSERPSLHLLLGRIDLRAGEPERAEGELRRAAELGMPAGVLQPYLAEASFQVRRFDEARRRVGEMNGGGACGTVERVRRYWS